ncbi:MAG: RING finger domain-containing protein [Promethearchaeota archaeon]
MVTKKDFDKIIVNFLRANPYVMNIALIDAEGIPISFALKSRKYQIKPATLGSKTKALLFLSKLSAEKIDISYPIIQTYFFEELALIIINLKIVNIFVLLDVKGWPPNGKHFYEIFVKIRDLLLEIEKEEESTLKSLLSSEKQDEFRVSDVNDTFLRIIAKNLNSLNQVKIDPNSTNASSQVLKKDDIDSLKTYLKQKLSNLKLVEGTCFSETGEDLFLTQTASSDFKTSIQEFFENSEKELEIFNLGELLWFINIYEKSELEVGIKLGKLKNQKIYIGILAENRMGTITEITKALYTIIVDLYSVQKDDYLKKLAILLEYIGLSIDNIKIRIEKLLVKNQLELAEKLTERAAILLELQQQYSAAGDYLEKLAEIYAKKGELENAEQTLLKASELHLKEKNYTSTGDSFLKIGDFSKMADNKTKAFEFYSKAADYYNKAKNTNKIKIAENKIKEIQEIIKEQIKDYLESTTGESIPFNFLEEKFNLSEKALVDILKLMLERNEIPGQINLIKKRYTKKRFGTKEAVVGEIEFEVEPYEMPTVDVNSLMQQQRKLEAELEQYENVFERINFPFEKYLEYQEKLMELNFIEQKLTILGKNINQNTCPLCLKSFNNEDQISDCGNGHYYHLNCLKIWLENQKKCPICDTNILDNLKIYYLDTIQAKDDLLSMQDLVKTLKIKINNLEKELRRKEEQIYLMKEYSEKDKSIFEKLMIERDNKHLLEKELKKRDRMIQELRSILDIIKK